MHRPSILIVISLFLALVFTASAADFRVELKNRQFEPQAFDDVRSELEKFIGRHAIVQLNQTPDLAQRNELAEQGVSLLKPISGKNWLARINGEVRQQKAVSAVRWVGEILPSDKIDKRLAEGRVLPHSVYDDNRRALDIGLHRDVAVQRGREILAAVGALELDYARLTNSFIVALALDQVQQIAGYDEVSWVSEAGPALTPLLDEAKPAVGADVANEVPYSVTGAGVVAFILDGGTISADPNSHPDLAGRVTVAGFPIPDFIGHPTHVGCIVGGSGFMSDGRFQGMAPDVRIISSSLIPGLTLPAMYDAPGNMEDAYQTAITQHGATVSNNSIGSNLAQFGTRYCEMEGDYERTAQLIDEIAGEKFGRISIVWANGNERGHNDGACGNAYYTTAPPATAKNSLTVGAVNKEDLSMTQFSSWGPTDDGRIRPDVAAPGCAKDGTSIISCSGPFTEGDYMGMCGTSMASPVVTGSVALVQEYWRRAYEGADAAASTMKALFIHGAVPVAADGPDYKFGYGPIDVPATLDLIDEALIIEQTIDQGGEFIATLVPTGDTIRATLSWTDPAGERLAMRVLVNDLDLSIDTGEEVRLPWILNPADPGLAATRGENHLDPVEQVEFNPSDDLKTVDVIVRAPEVPQGPQFFSLVLSGLVEPTSGDDDDDDDDDNDAAGNDDDDDDDNGCGC